jgi:hypothetical protein
VTVYWLPDPATKQYQPVEFGETPMVKVDVYCRPCGAHKPNRLSRFVRPAVGGPIGVQRFRVGEELTQNAFWVGRDGELRWRLVCGHDANIGASAVAWILNHGLENVLWPDPRVIAAVKNARLLES